MTFSELIGCIMQPNLEFHFYPSGREGDYTMKRKSLGLEECPLARSLEVMGDAWSVLISEGPWVVSGADGLETMGRRMRRAGGTRLGGSSGWETGETARVPCTRWA